MSRGATLEKDSLILTGSPVALGRRNPTDAADESPFMRDGDEVECWVEGIGTLINTVRHECDDDDDDATTKSNSRKKAKL
ncbi:hypothetical protein JCM11491_002323 [Sporobolomyces phaffii]